MLADKKSQFPDMAPSGVRHDIFVAFMTCFKYSRGSLRLLGQLVIKGTVRKNDLRHCGADIHSVLPLKFGPHTSELFSSVSIGAKADKILYYLGFVAVRWLYIVHDVDVDVIEDDASFRHVRSFPQDAAKNNASFRRGYLGTIELAMVNYIRRLKYFNGCLDTLKAVWSNCVNCRPFYNFQIPQSRKI